MSLNEISKNINKIETTKIEKNKFAEFSSPFVLRKDMINSIPTSFWKNPNRKVLEPCCGKGGFLIDVLSKFMDNLNIPIERRYKHIVEKILYFGDINKNNVNICRKILGNYKLNFFIGDALEQNLSNFDLVIGNPPYNTERKETGNAIYQKFIKKALEDWIKPGGYLLFVAPNSWRKPTSKHSKNAGMYELMTQENWMKYLEIHNQKDAKKIFNAATRYDWYLIKKSKPKNTVILDEKGKTNKINLKNWEWIPNFNFKLIKKLLAKKNDDKVEILHDTKFDSERKQMSKKKSSKFKYPCIHSTPQKGVVYFYSSQKLENKKPKVIFGNSGVYETVINKKGKYCMTEHAMGIVDKPQNLERIKKALQSPQMKEILKACLWSNFQIDWKLFTYFKKDFYKMIYTF